MPDSAAIRANWSKYTLRHLRRLPAATRDHIRAAIGDATLQQIGAAGVLAWLPAEHHARIFDAVWKVLGEAGAVSFWCDVMSANLDQPLLRPLVQGGMRLFGGSPYAIIRMSPHAWTLVTRGCGTQSVSRGQAPVELRLSFTELPRALSTPGFIAHCKGNCEAVLRLLRLRAVIAVADERLGALALEMRDVQARGLAVER